MHLVIWLQTSTLKEKPLLLKSRAVIYTRVIYTKNIRIFCTPTPQQFLWEKIDLSEPYEGQMNNAVKGGFQANINENLFIGKVYHEGECKIGKVIPIPNTFKGLWVWYNVDGHPASEVEWLNISNDFYNLRQIPNTIGALDGKHIAFSASSDAGSPNTIGALDGKHIAFSASSDAGSMYYNYKGFLNIVLLALTDAKYRFIYIDVGVNGSDNVLLTVVTQQLLVQYFKTSVIMCNIIYVISLIYFASSFAAGAATPNYYWRDYFPGEIPYDAVEGCAGRYIGQVHHIHGDLVATIYPQSETAVAEIEDTGRIIYTKNIRIFCTPTPYLFRWQKIDVSKPFEGQMTNAVKGGLQEVK
ncbi:hypothetical protein QE152_g4475 [Popillia japonica]|uniref:Uncharacterized protein n=1 Tax=Popillia japonica TaxID=7064 RepID=A0AAW1MYN8_POPJA